jgi:hypothetical protein
VDDRELIGAGIRYKILRFANGDITLGTAYMFEKEKYDLPVDSIHPDEESVSRWSNYVAFYLQINSMVNLGSVAYYQPVFDRFSDYRILNENSLTVALTQRISFSFNFRLRYDSDPPAIIKQMDTNTNIGIVLKF